MNWRKVHISTWNTEEQHYSHDIMELTEPSIDDITEGQEKHCRKQHRYGISPKLNNDLNLYHGLLMEKISKSCNNLQVLKIDFDGESWTKNQTFLKKY